MPPLVVMQNRRYGVNVEEPRFNGIQADRPYTAPPKFPDADVARLALVLFDLAQTFEPEVGHVIIITRPVSHDELAEMAGLTEPEVSQAIERLRGLGLVDVRRQRFILREL